MFLGMEDSLSWNLKEELEQLLKNKKQRLGNPGLGRIQLFLETKNQMNLSGNTEDALESSEVTTLVIHV